MKCAKCGRQFIKPQLWFSQDVREFVATANFNVVFKVEGNGERPLCLKCSGEVILLAASALQVQLQALAARAQQAAAHDRKPGPNGS
jgi:hypothetical protein